MQSHDSDLVYHVHNHVVHRLRCRIRIRSLTRSMVSVPTRFCVVVGRISCDRCEDLCRLYHGHIDIPVVLFFSIADPQDTLLSW